MAEFKGKRGRKPAWTREVKPHARKVRTMPPKNLMGKARKPGNPYIVLDQPGGGWRTEVLKTYQADGHKPYGRALVLVTSAFTGAHGDLGDTYVDGLRPLTLEWFDPEVFANADYAAAALFGAGAVA